MCFWNCDPESFNAVHEITQYKLKSISSKNTIHTTKAKHFVTAWYEKPKNYCEKWGRGNFSSACTQKDKHEI